MNEDQALVVAESQELRLVNDRLTIEQVHAQLEFVRSLMAKEMREGEDYGAIPGCGTKPTLLQPGAQKLLMTFNLIDEVKKEVLRDFPGFHREYEFTITVKAQNGKSWDGVGTCSTLEAKYRYRSSERTCPKCGKQAIIKGKAEYGGGWICFAKKGGCGAKWPDGAKEIEGQEVGKVEHDNPPDYWNTVRKMAFKRGLVHASINATNTSELWTQDLEDMPNGAEPPRKSATSEYIPEDGAFESAKPAQANRADPPATLTQAAPQNAPKGNLGATKHATEATRKWFVYEFLAEYDRRLLEQFFRALKWLGAEQPLQDLPLRFVPASGPQARLIRAILDKFRDGEPAVEPWKPLDVAPEPQVTGWRAHKVVWTKGKFANESLGSLPKDFLYQMWRTYEVKDTWEDATGVHAKSEVSIEKDRAFRAALDEAGKELQFTDQPA